jgi:ribonuclease HI
MAEIIIYTDGAAKGNPGNGGYGTILISGKFRKELSEGYKLTTNNRMELLAVIVGLEALKTENNDVTIYSDSKYVIDSIEKNWIVNWLKTDFKGKKNKDLWLQLLQTYKKQKVKFVWVKGHSGNIENENCDKLAVKASEKKTLLIDEVYENTIKEQNENTIF